MSSEQTYTIQFRAPLEADAPSISELLRRAWPEGTQAQRDDIIDRGKLTVDDHIWRDAKRAPAEGTLLEASVPAGQESYGIPEAVELARGDHWIIVDKPTGMPSLLVPEDPMNPILFLADMLGLERDLFTPAFEIPTQGGGPWLFGMDPDTANSLARAWANGDMMLTFMALVPRLELPRGHVTGAGGVSIMYSVTRYVDGLCEVQLIPDYTSAKDASSAPDPFTLLLDALAELGSPALGDSNRGGYMVDGGLRLRLAAVMLDSHELGHSWEAPADWWPDAPVIYWVKPGEEDTSADEDFFEPRSSKKQRGTPASFPNNHPSLRVSDKTLEILHKHKHPWVLSDSHTAGRAHLRPGTLVSLKGRGGQVGPWALIEGNGELAARVWAQPEDLDAVNDFDGEVAMRLDAAIVARSALMRDLSNTNLFRLIHGEADGLPGLIVDRVGPMLRITITGHTCRGFRRMVYSNLLEHDPKITLLELWHTEDVRRQGDLPTARIIHDGGIVAPGQRVVGLEDGLRYWCEPWEGIDVGFFADQRDNRRKVVELARPGQRWLNLFGHTGAFSVALANRGAAVVNVDVSKRYVDWTAENFELNNLDPALDIGVADDARTYVSQSNEAFDGIIVDPPTAAQGKAGFWSVRKDYGELLVKCFERLTPGGVMLVCRNDKKAKGDLEKLIRQSARKAGHKISTITPAPPSSDYPNLKGFPEGDRFEGLLVR